MKTTKILFIAAAAVAMTLASCTKEQTGTTENGQTSGLRTLTVSFATSPTRTTLDGMQPKWKENDQILLADGNAQQTITVTSADAGKTSFEITTSLTGTITAVYPKSAADISGNIITGIKVSNAPDGKFASANICKATAAATENELSFENQTAIIKVEVPTGTKKLTLTSLNPIDNSGQRASSGAVAIADASSTTITVGNGSSDIPNLCYVSILAPASGAVLLQDLNVDVDGTAQGGFSPSAIKAKDKNPSSYAVKANTIYTLSKESLHEYVTVDGKKWATMNVGASSSTDTGLYFAWGETTGHEEDDAKTAFKDGHSFSWANAPFNNGQSSYDETYFGSVKDTVCPNGVLALAYDAAFWNWGGAWRMPTQEEFVGLAALVDVYGGWDSINNRYRFTDAIFLPFVGYGDGADLLDAGSDGGYWMSSLEPDYPDCAYFLSFLDGSIAPYADHDRYYGFPVRPLSE